MSETKETKAAKKQIGNKTTEIIVGAAAVKLTSAVKALNEACDEVNKLEQKSQDCILKVTDLEDKIGGLETDLMNKTNQNKIELKQAYETDRKSFVAKYCQENNLVCVVSTEYSQLEQNLKEATTNMQNEINKSVGAATSNLKKEHENAMKIAQLEHEKKEAANLAEINQLKAQNAFLSQQIADTRKLLETQMSNETERSKYGQIGTLNVNGNEGQRR